MKPVAPLLVAAFIALGGAVITTRARPRPRVVPTLAPLLWSNPRTWATGHVPRTGDAVTLPEGRAVILDTDPPPLQSVTIGGAGTMLVFGDTADRTLTASQITVAGAGAKLIVGAEAKPFAHRATIRLRGSKAQTPMLSVSGAGARLELFGERGRTAWTRLAETAPAGADTVTLASGATHWRPGDVLVIAPTGYDTREAETRTVQSVSGATVRFTVPLRYRHFGRVTVRGVGEQAEVGLLSRNIVVEGAESVGGCVMVMGWGAGARLSDAEFRHLGVAGEKGKYPVHFHRVINGAGSFVNNCAIHDTYNRFVTVHGTRHVSLTNNVGYNTVGHGYFLEDGDETDTVLENNLGVLVRMPAPGKAVTPSDTRPAVFWTANPANALRGNVAAGSDYYGFWLDFPQKPTGAATDSPLRPRRMPLGVFERNTAHTCEHDGLFVDNANNPPGVTGAPTYDPPAPAFFRDFFAYKCRRRGCGCAARAYS